MIRRILPVLFLLLAGFLHAAEDPQEKLITLAEKEAPEEVQLQLIKSTGRLSGFFAKVREVESVDGWQQVRAKGEAAFASWDNAHGDFVWQSRKFEVRWDIVKDGKRLRLFSVTLDGVERRAEQ